MSEQQHTLRNFCDAAKKNTIIIPKDIPGYITPPGQELTTKDQVFNFIYTPIQYKIKYKLDGGVFETPAKKSYTIEDPDYIPESPIKDGFKFIGWEPEYIPAKSIGDKVLKAIWKPNAILLSGNKLNQALDVIAKGKNNIISIQYTSVKPESNYINLSCTSTPIFATFDNGIIYLYSEDQIHCNPDMQGAFSGCDLLRDISIFSTFVCKEDTNISNLFYGCTVLSDLEPISQWGNFGLFSNFSNAFTNTEAMLSRRVPEWYNWSVKLKFVSSTGKLIKEDNDIVIPNETLYPESIDGYKLLTKEIVIDDPKKEYVLEYEPIKYSIEYILDGAELLNPKTEYTVEDLSYYPASPYKYGKEFSHWTPTYIESGDFGNKTFVATFKD